MLQLPIMISPDAPYNLYRHEISLIAGSCPAAAELRRIQLDSLLGIVEHGSRDIPLHQPDLLVDMPRVQEVQSVRCTSYLTLR